MMRPRERQSTLLASAAGGSLRGQIRLTVCRFWPALSRKALRSQISACTSRRLRLTGDSG